MHFDCLQELITMATGRERSERKTDSVHSMNQANSIDTSAVRPLEVTAFSSEAALN